MLPCTKRLEAVVLCRAQGDSEWSDWPGEMQKKSPQFRCPPPTHPVSENNCYIHTKQTRTHLSQAAYIFLVLENPQNSVNFTGGQIFHSGITKNKPNKFDNNIQEPPNSKTKSEKDAMQCNSGCLHCSFSRSQSTWPRDQALMGHAPWQGFHV